MKTFVNREDELVLIGEAFDTLLDRQRLLRTPIVEFYGVEGIGKTTMLTKVKERCVDENVPYIWADASENAPVFSRTILDQVREYSVRPVPKDSRGDLRDQFMCATTALLEKGPVVILLDCVDRADEEQLGWIEVMMRDLVEEGKLFVALASRRMLGFDISRSVARKLTPLALHPLNRESCESYLSETAISIEHAVRDIIFEWTRGYPLAMDVMTGAILGKGLDPREQQDRKQLQGIITEKVINQAILSSVRPDELDRYQKMLSVLSVPRRFNLIMMQDIIEQYAAEYRLESSLAYIGLPKEVNQATGALGWSMSRGGFSVDVSVRNIFLLKLEIEQPDIYFAIHRTLAEKNERLAGEVPGPDRVRYLREFFYHIAQNPEPTPSLTSILERNVQQIILEESHEICLQFHEELVQDKDLGDSLGQHAGDMLSLLRKHLGLEE